MTVPMARSRPPAEQPAGGAAAAAAEPERPDPDKMKVSVSPADPRAGRPRRRLAPPTPPHLLFFVAGNQDRELNPFYKEGGTGLPPEEVAAARAAGLGVGHTLRPAAVGDGGASWRLKALQRARQQAEQEVRAPAWEEGEEGTGEHVARFLFLFDNAAPPAGGRLLRSAGRPPPPLPPAQRLHPLAACLTA